MSSNNAPPGSGSGGTVDWANPGSLGSTNPNSVTSTNLTTSGSHIDTPTSTQTLTAASVITPTGTIIPISASSAITLSSSPQISAGVTGQSLTLVNVGGQNITFTSAGITWGQSTYTLFSGRAITLIYSSSLSTWLPVSTIPPDVKLYGNPTVDNQTGNSANSVIANTTYVNRSNRPAVNAYISTTTQTIANNADPPTVNIIYNTKTLDTDNAYNPATGIFTVPTGMGGLYQVNASVWLQSQASKSYIVVYINGVRDKLIGSSTDPNGIVSGSSTLFLNSGDTLTIRSIWVGTLTSVYLAARADLSYLSIYRLNV